MKMLEGTTFKDEPISDLHVYGDYRWPNRWSGPAQAQLGTGRVGTKLFTGRAVPANEPHCRPRRGPKMI